jgi:hypothetical protein
MEAMNFLEEEIPLMAAFLKKRTISMSRKCSRNSELDDSGLFSEPDC